MSHTPNLKRGEASLIYLQRNGFWHRKRDNAKIIFFNFMEGLIYSGEISINEIQLKLKKMEALA